MADSLGSKKQTTTVMTDHDDDNEEEIGEKDATNAIKECIQIDTEDEETFSLLKTSFATTTSNKGDHDDEVECPPRRPRPGQENLQITRRLTAWIVFVVVVLLLVYFVTNTKESTIATLTSNATATISSDASSNTANSKLILTPPVARREEDRVFYAGKISIPMSTLTSADSLPRQARNSIHPLLDPPVAVPDPYGWLRDESRSDPEVLQHLEVENNYTYGITNSSPAFLKAKESIFNRIKSMMNLDDSSYTFPILDRDYYYYRRTVPGKSYPVHCRARAWDATSNEDENSKFDSHGSYLRSHIENWEERGKKNDNDNNKVRRRRQNGVGTATRTGKVSNLKDISSSSSHPLLPNEVIYLDENELAQDYDFFNIGTIVISRSQRYMAYTVDTTGDEQYYIVVQKIIDDEDDPDQLYYWEDPSMIVGEELVWGNDDMTLFYTKMDDTQRTNSVYRRRIHFNGRELRHQEEEVILFEEPDALYWVGISKTTDQRYLLILIGSSESSEIRYVDLFAESVQDETELKVVAERRPMCLYDVDHRHGVWWMISTEGDDVSEYQLWVSFVDGGDSSWKRVQDPGQNLNAPLLDKISISDLTAFDRHVIIQGREGGMVRIWVITFKDGENDDGSGDGSDVGRVVGNSIRSCERLEWDVNEPAYLVEVGANMDFYSSSLVVEYESMITPRRYIELLLHSESNVSISKAPRVVIMETKVPGYDRDVYACDRINILARDGITQIPVSIVSRKDVMQRVVEQSAFSPLHLYAYGAYGESMDDWFSTPRVALLDNGFIYAVAHVRGGGELGRAWYEDGKYLNKTHTFDDVVDVARYFVHDVKWTTPDRLSCEGRSAGGLTMGGAINQSPTLFRAAILGVPFVDVVATMTDPSIPLTEPEWLEWGNPNEGYYFDTMMSYSPMQNVVSGVQYPSVLLLAGLHDPRVQYWEPAKFTQELRYHQNNSYKSNSSSASSSRNDDKNKSIIILKTDMTSGHFSASDRYKNIESKSFEYAFIVWQITGDG